jgi:glycerol 2-dehydrogenase (NADP+)
LYLKEYCDKKGILLEAYSPLGSTGVSNYLYEIVTYFLVIDSPLLGDAELKKIADKYNVPPATILISWSVNKGIVVLPKSVTPSRKLVIYEALVLAEVSARSGLQLENYQA